MSDIVQILPDKKFADAPKSTLVFPFTIEGGNKTFTEYTVFKRINQLDQFYVDKSKCTNFRFSGKINETVNLDFSEILSVPTISYVYDLRLLDLYSNTGQPVDVYITINENSQHLIIQMVNYNIQYFYDTLTAAYDTELKAGDFTFELGSNPQLQDEFVTVKPKNKEVVVSSSNYPLSVQVRQLSASVTQETILPKFSDFDVSSQNNWKVMLMAPLNSGNPKDRGGTGFTVSDAGVERTFNLTQGLPALAIESEVIGNKTRNGLLLYLGHNLQTNDVVHIESTISDDRYKNGNYRIVFVRGNKVYLQLISLDKTDSSLTTGTTASSSTSNEDFTPMMTTTGGSAIINEEAIIGGIELGITWSEFHSITGRTDVPVANWLAVYNPHVFVTKVVDKVPCVYYLKRLYLLREMDYDDIYSCAFSNNIYSQPVYLYNIEQKMPLMNQLSNMNMPITDVYLSFVKNVNPGLKMTSVWASFSNFVTSTFDGGELQIVSVKPTNSVSANTNQMSADGTEEASGNDVSYDVDDMFLYHSLVEYNPILIQEQEILKVHHTFITNTGDTEENHVRFSYDPFVQIPIRKMSNNIDTSSSVLGLPEYVEESYRNSFYNEKFQDYRWRHILEIGYFEAQGNGIDFPYLNDAFYVHTNALLNVKNHKSPKVPSLLTGGYILSSYIDTLTMPPDVDNTTNIDQLDDSLLNENKYDKPYEEYKGGICV